jgi:DNA-binding transcriptional LysR family regulator
MVLQSETKKHLQLVLTDRSNLTQGRDFGVTSTQVWRLADLGAKHAFLRAGLGWGHMPLHMVQEDLLRGELQQIDLEKQPNIGIAVSMHAVHNKETPPGPAGRWFISRLKNPEMLP